MNFQNREMAQNEFLKLKGENEFQKFGIGNRYTMVYCHQYATWLFGKSVSNPGAGWDGLVDLNRVGSKRLFSLMYLGKCVVPDSGR